MASAEIGVMVVDDSAVVRQVLGELVSAAPGLRLLATAQDPIIAEQKMLGEWPDVLVLDIEMPRMDGITFLRRIMQKRPTPVLICSSHTEQGARSTLEALAAGAVGVVAKPRLGVRDFLSDSGQDLIQSIREAASSRPRAAGACAARPTATAASLTQTVPRAGTAAQPSLSGRRIVALGTSTGGTQALERVLSALPANAPGLVIVQHMPEHFTSAFADRLNRLCAIEVKEAQHGDRVQVGRALIAPGGRHMRLAGSAGNYRVDVLDGPPINRHKPSVDVLFRSVAQTAGVQAVGVLMTGMGDDGARGLHEMHNCGARTYAQDESSCVVFGMPREAILLGAVDEVLPLDRIGPEIARIPS